MKYGSGTIKLFLLIFTGLIFSYNATFSQVYSATNNLMLVIKGNSRSYNYYSTAISSALNIPCGEFVINGLFKTFTLQNDTTNKLSIDKFFDPMAYPGFTLRFNPVDFSLLDRSTGNKQIIQMNGDLLIGSTNFPISTNVEFIFMDKQLFFRLDIPIKLQEQTNPISTPYRKILGGNINFKVEEGRLLYKSQ